MDATPSEPARSTFPPEMAFRRTWRSYQVRLLDQLDSLLNDRRLHVVAAPGSGKTVFGLEVIRRINQPTLVLAPTIAIRNQWVERLVEHFLPPGASQPQWVSTDIRLPERLTVVTYQALHALCSGERDRTGEQTPEEETVEASPNRSSDTDDDFVSPASSIQVPESLAGFRTLVVDEAHHMRSEWWRTLTAVHAHLDPAMVALTATPPYDVSPHEWQRYEELCGPVDADLAIPELVLQGNLCPHQDYVYLSTPADREQQTVSEFRDAVAAFVQRLRENQDFSAAVASHRWVTKPEDHLEPILENPAYLSSMVVYLHAVGGSIPPAVLHALGISHKKIPALDLSWLEILLTQCLYADAESFASIAAHLKTIRHTLLQIGASERRKVVLRNPSDHRKLQTTSVTKLHSIEEIVRLEAGAQSQGLRCVILTDFIRRAEMPKHAADVTVFEDVGVVPIFETLRRLGLPNISLGVLCGSLVIIPVACTPLLNKAAAALGIDPSDVILTPLTHDPDFCILELAGPYRQCAVRLLTAVFEEGGITVLVGTKSLLGEGWDAPTINTLVLASFVGSYVLSNQMRGRSIRVDPARPEKTANIWHLVCVEPGPFGPGSDYELLVRRCRAFLGVSATAPTIENGTQRLGLGDPPFTRHQVKALNALTCSRALDRDGLRRGWDEALAAGPLQQMAYGLKAGTDALPRGFLLVNTIAALLVQAVSTFVTYFLEFMRPVRNLEQDTLAYVAIVTAITALLSLPWALMALWRFIRHGTPERSMKQIGTAVLEGLEYQGSMTPGAGKFKVHADRNPDGSVYCWIAEGTGREQGSFVRALRDVLGPVDDPRYLLVRRSVWKIFGEDYFAVPDILSRKKEFAEMFASRWRRRVGPVQLVYTRTPEGRKILLRARTHSLAAAFQDRSELVSCWK